jgi:hypothetical protein
VVKYLAWAPRVEGRPYSEKVDDAVRESAGFLLDSKYPLPGWVAGNRLGGQLTMSSERFPGSVAVWVWEA